jgi:hypothetical protein
MTCLLILSLQQNPGQYPKMNFAKLLIHPHCADPGSSIPVENIFPAVNINSSPEEKMVFSSGQTISISGSVKNDKALGGLYIGLLYEG